jgi:hypothetical protein
MRKSEIQQRIERSIHPSPLLSNTKQNRRNQYIELTKPDSFGWFLHKDSQLKLASSWNEMLNSFKRGDRKQSRKESRILFDYMPELDLGLVPKLEAEYKARKVIQIALKQLELLVQNCIVNTQLPNKKSLSIFSEISVPAVEKYFDAILEVFSRQMQAQVDIKTREQELRNERFKSVINSVSLPFQLHDLLPVFTNKRRVDFRQFTLHNGTNYTVALHVSGLWKVQLVKCCGETMDVEYYCSQVQKDKLIEYCAQMQTKAEKQFLPFDSRKAWEFPQSSPVRTVAFLNLMRCVE